MIDVSKEREIKIIVTERETLDKKKKFLTYKAVQKNGKLIDCKFVKEVTPPKEDSYIIVQVSNMNIDRSGQYPCLWVKAVDNMVSVKSKIKDVVDTEVESAF